MLDFDKNYLCPFCLVELRLREFKAIGKHFFKCPECGQKYKREILLIDLPPKDLGIWIHVNMRIFNQPNRPFRDRIDKDNFYRRLTNNFPKWIRKDFWEGYNYVTENPDKINQEYDRLYNKIFPKTVKQKTLLTENKTK